MQIVTAPVKGTAAWRSSGHSGTLPIDSCRPLAAAVIVGHRSARRGSPDPAARHAIVIRDRSHGPLSRVSIDNLHDINRDGSVNTVGLILARDNITSPLSALRLISPRQPE